MRGSISILEPSRCLRAARQSVYGTSRRPSESRPAPQSLEDELSQATRRVMESCSLRRDNFKVKLARAIRWSGEPTTDQHRDAAAVTILPPSRPPSSDPASITGAAPTSRRTTRPQARLRLCGVVHHLGGCTHPRERSWQRLARTPLHLEQLQRNNDGETCSTHGTPASPGHYVRQSYRRRSSETDSVHYRIAAPWA